MGPRSVHCLHCAMWFDTFAQWVDLWLSSFSVDAFSNYLQNSHCLGLMCYFYNPHYSYPFASESEVEGIHVEKEDMGPWPRSWDDDETERSWDACPDAYTRDS